MLSMGSSISLHNTGERPAPCATSATRTVTRRESPKPQWRTAKRCSEL
jgi:hypothetical protein